MDQNRTARLQFAGELDVYRRTEFERAFPPPDRIDRIVLDMRETTILDSTIIAILMRYRRAFVEAGRRAEDIVVIVRPNVRRIFDITGIVSLLTVVTALPGERIAQT